VQAVYSNQFIIASESLAGKALLQAVVMDCKAWVADSLHRQTGETLPLEGWQKGVKTPSATVSLQLRDTANTLWAEIVYEHDAKDEPGKRWRTRMRLGFFQDILEFQIDIFTGYTSTVLRPPSKDGSQPRIVLILAQKYQCLRAGTRLLPMAQRFSTNNIPHLVASITSPDRRLPIILLTPGEEGRTLVSPNVLQERLLGLAEVVFLRDSFATAAFNTAVGDALHAFDGGVRILWPHATLKDHPFANPLYTPSRLAREGAATPREVERFLCRRMYTVGVTMSVDSAVITSAWQAAEKERREAALAQTTLKGLQTEVERQEQVIEGYKAALQERDDRINFLEGELSRAMRRAPAAETPVDFGAALTEAKTAGEVVELAEQAFDRLIIHPRALKESAGYKSRHLDDLWFALEVLNDVAQQFRPDGSLGKPFAQACRDAAQKRGRKLPKLAMSDSETNLTEFGDERMVEFEGRPLQLAAHYTLGLADPEGCIHVFFEPFPQRGKILVGYVGPHLSYASE
jgi:hypothetical protein